MKKFVLFLIGLMLGVSVVYAQPVHLQLGEPRSDVLDSKTTTLNYTFDGQAGSLIYVSAFSPDVYTGMRLFGPNGTLLTTVDTNVIGSVIGPYQLSIGGTYRVEVFRQEWEDSAGEVEVTFGLAEITTIKPDGVYTGRLDHAGDIAFFTYYGTLNQLFGYSAQGDDIALGFALPSGETFLSDGIDSFLSEPINILPEEGEYTAYLQTVSDTGTDYELRLQPVRPLDLTVDETIEGRFSEAEPVIFRFESAADLLWGIDTLISSANSNSWIEVYFASDPYSVIEADYGSGVNYSPRIATLLTPFSGTYYAVLRANDYEFGNRSFDYSITLSESSVTFLEAGVPVQGTYSPDTGSVIFNYRGAIDERVEVYFQITSNQGQPSIRILSPDDELASFFTRSGTEAIFDLILPQNAIYEIVIDSVAYDFLSFEFEIELRSLN